ncbi:MAG: cytochrome c-type biogenesis protein [Parvularcula sp.]|jgi:cytochrome c-type biogenesis protein CcmH|nr:cytochrome c-type biogenesis protein [Parvularcula sp.]
MLAVLALLAAQGLSAEQEARLDDLSEEVRCVVCQNQSIAESDAEIAQMMRGLLAERIAAGDTDREALDYLTARYGEVVLLKPSLSSKNMALWAGPILAAVLGAGFLFSLFRSGAKAEE